LIYKDKEYRKEADFIEECFERYSKPKRILEIGCGTGNYTRIFSERGYGVTGIDISEEMLAVARGKCDCNFLNMDIRNISLPLKFDCCLALFAVMGYVTDDSDLRKAFLKIREHLERGGIFIFDVWNGLAVLKHLPEDRMKEVEDDTLRIKRFAHPTLRASNNLCDVDYRLIASKKSSKEVSEINEKHVVRYYFPREIENYLEHAGFEVLKICPFLDLDGEVTEDVWNMTVVARAV
jgi:SAM-dependent methyltransferase